LKDFSTVSEIKIVGKAVKMRVPKCVKVITW
jgi:hypothetical protein